MSSTGQLRQWRGTYFYCLSSDTNPSLAILFSVQHSSILFQLQRAYRLNEILWMFLKYVPYTHYTHPIGISAWNTRLAASHKPDDGSYAPGRYVALMIMISSHYYYYYYCYYYYYYYCYCYCCYYYYYYYYYICCYYFLLISSKLFSTLINLS